MGGHLNREPGLSARSGLGSVSAVESVSGKHLDQGLCLHLFGWQLRNGPRKIRRTDVERNQTVTLNFAG